ncbi:3'(2'),5'-bisphosphate nucleotidase CysQ [Eionea flava]
MALAQRSYSELVPPLLALIARANNAVMEVYQGRVLLNPSLKSDASPVTAADLAAHKLLVDELPSLLANTPILSEEGELPSYAIRQHWERYWLIDPLDGTKEFLAKNGEFTVNIALIEHGYPVLGVVSLPVSGEVFYGSVGQGAYKLTPDASQQQIFAQTLPCGQDTLSCVRVLMGRRNTNDDTQSLKCTLNQRFPFVDYAQSGSSLKFCRVAEGKADLYPRLAPTREWDTAAAQAIVEAAGGYVVDAAFDRLRYNTKDSVINPHFYVVGKDKQRWQAILQRWPED